MQEEAQQSAAASSVDQIPTVTEDKRKRSKKTIKDRLNFICQNLNQFYDGLGEDVKKAKLKNSITLIEKLKDDSKIIIEKRNKKVISEIGEARADSAQSSSRTGGFNKLYDPTPETREFLQLDANAQVTWGELAKVVNKYIKENNLQDSQKKSFIMPDERLARLLRYNKEQDGQIQFTSMQKLFKRCFLQWV